MTAFIFHFPKKINAQIMPPPKAKLHKNTGRLKNINSSHGNSMLSGNREHQVVTNTLNSRSNTRNEVSASGNNSAESPAIEQFELELYWCIQTLENSLNSGKLNAKQGKIFNFYPSNECEGIETYSKCHLQSNQSAWIWPRFWLIVEWCGRNNRGNNENNPF